MITDDSEQRVYLALLPLLWTGYGEYDGIDCYVLSIEGQKEYVDRETGLLLARFYNNKQKENIEYEFGEVTDEDIAKPDLSQYEYME